MPARTLSPLVAADPLSLSPASFQMYSPPTMHQARDGQEGRRRQSHSFTQDIHAHFEASRRYSTLVHINHNPLTNRDHALSLPPSLQRTSYAHWHASHPHSSTYAATHHPASLMTGWLPHAPTMERMPPPPPILHKVWILDCQSCGTFLTNRGMKVSLARCYVFATDCGES